MRRIMIQCCDVWAKAHEAGTDNEMYSSLISDESDGESWMGSELPAVRFCPWCGKPKECLANK